MNLEVPAKQSLEVLTSTVTQELELNENQLNGPIPEGWQLPVNLTVRRQAAFGAQLVCVRWAFAPAQMYYRWA